MSNTTRYGVSQCALLLSQRQLFPERIKTSSGRSARFKLDIVAVANPKGRGTSRIPGLRTTGDSSITGGVDGPEASNRDDRSDISTDRRTAIATMAVGACSTAAYLSKVGDQDTQQQLWSDERFAATMRDGMRDYERRIEPVKQELFGKADLDGKDVVEIGLGSGPSIPLYSKLGVNSLVGVEPNLAMHDMARQSAKDCSFQDKVTIVPGFAENLPLPDCSADIVVCSMLLCSVSDVEASVAEIQRVLKPGGKYVFVEHISAPRGSVLRAMQTVFDPLQQACACGCHLARDPLARIRAAGWEKLDAEYFSLGQTLEEAAAAADGTRGWRPSDGPPPPHFLLSPHLGGIAYKQV